jgi:hypothetical protein
MAKEKIFVHFLETYKKRIQSVLVGEGRAYGFTLLISGTGFIIMDKYGMPQAANIFIFSASALVAIFLLMFFSFGNIIKPITTNVEVNVYPVGLVHIFSVLGGIGSAYLTCQYVPKIIVYEAVPFAATIVYNLLLGLESSAATK